MATWDYLAHSGLPSVSHNIMMFLVWSTIYTLSLVSEVYKSGSFVLPIILMFPKTKLRETLKCEGKQNHLYLFA